MKKPPRLKQIRVWATWRGPGWVPCLWSTSYRDATSQQDQDEYVIRVNVSQARSPKKPRSQRPGGPTR